MHHHHHLPLSSPSPSIFLLVRESFLVSMMMSFIHERGRNLDANCLSSFLPSSSSSESSSSFYFSIFFFFGRRLHSRCLCVEFLCKSQLLPSFNKNPPEKKNKTKTIIYSHTFHSIVGLLLLAAAASNT